MAISPLIFQLDYRSKAQNIGNAHGYSAGKFNFRCKKCLSRPPNGSHFENVEILNTTSIWHQVWEDHPKLYQKKFFSRWWCHQWRHRLTLNSPSTVMFRIILLWEQVARAISSMNADSVTVFLGYTCLEKISVYNTFQDRRSNVRVTGLLGDHRNSVNLWVIKDETKMTCRKYLWLCCNGNQDSVSLLVSKIAWCRIWRSYWMTVKVLIS